MPAEMHHVKKIKELKNRKPPDWFTMQMAAINRKQIPLCKDHHKQLHSASLSKMEKTAFAEGCKEFSANVT